MRLHDLIKESERVDERGVSRVWRHMQEHDTGTITAFRYAKDCGEGDVYTKSQNKGRNKQLLAKLMSKGYSVTAVQGKYIENFGTKDAREVGENVFLVVDIKDGGSLKSDLRKFGEEFDQDSILFIPKGGKSGSLIGTNKCPNGYPGYGKVVNLKNPVFGASGEFMTKVGGRPFILKEDIEQIYPPGNNMGMWAMSIEAKKEVDK